MLSFVFTWRHPALVWVDDDFSFAWASRLAYAWTSSFLYTVCFTWTFVWTSRVRFVWKSRVRFAWTIRFVWSSRARFVWTSRLVQKCSANHALIFPIQGLWNVFEKICPSFGYCIPVTTVFYLSWWIFRAFFLSLLVKFSSVKPF